MSDISEDHVRSLRLGIDGLVRRFRLTEGGLAGDAEKLNPIDVQALLYLDGHAGATATELGGYLGVVPTTTSAIADRLVRRGFISRDRVESNRRVVQLALTREGRAVVDGIVATQNAHCRAMLAALTPAERDALVSAIAKIGVATA